MMGFDVVQVGRAGRDAGRKLKLPEITFARASRAEREAIEQFVDWVMADPVYNIKAVPDVIERQIYINVFELEHAMAGLSTLDSSSWVGTSPCAAPRRGSRTRRASPQRAVRPNPEMLRRFAAETTDVEAVREVMCNVYAFVLAFVAFEMQGIETTIVGRRLRFGLGRPEGRLGDFRESRRVQRQPPEGARAARERDDRGRRRRGGGGARSRARRRGALTGAAEGLLGFVRGGSRSSASAPSCGVPQGGSAGAPRRPVEQTRGRGGGHLRHVRQNARTTFPYLNQAQFDAAVTDLVKALRPGKMVPKKAVSEVAAAADVNGDGVIQWAEYYFAAKELDEIFAKADEAAKAKAAEGGARERGSE